MDPISRKIALDEAQKGYHWRDGLFFAKTDQGNIRISKVEYIGENITGLSRQFIIPSAEWESIINALNDPKTQTVVETVLTLVPPSAQEISNVDQAAQSTQG